MRSKAATIFVSIAFGMLIAASPSSVVAQEGRTANRYTNVPDMDELKRLRNLSHRICANLQLDKSNGNRRAGYDIDRMITNFISAEPGHEPNPKSVGEFLDARNRYLICPKNHLFPRQHWMMRAIEMGFHKYTLVDHFLGAEYGYEIDVNFVVTDGKHQGTFLDYIDSVRKRPGYRTYFAYKEIEEMRFILTTFYNAKTSNELGINLETE